MGLLDGDGRVARQVVEDPAGEDQLASRAEELDRDLVVVGRQRAELRDPSASQEVLPAQHRLVHRRDHAGAAHVRDRPHDLHARHEVAPEIDDERRRLLARDQGREQPDHDAGQRRSVPGGSATHVR
jgi:hypothetical protein